LSIWQRNKQKGAKNGIKNDVKNVYRERFGKGNLEKWWENAFFLPGTVPKQ
jgi:tRNA uridine 5-carbamoylmethylation protein Kti12